MGIATYMLSVLFTTLPGPSLTLAKSTQSRPPTGPYQAKLPVLGGTTERPPGPISLNPDPFHTAGTPGLEGFNPRAWSGRWQAEVAAAHLSWVCGASSTTQC